MVGCGGDYLVGWVVLGLGWFGWVVLVRLMAGRLWELGIDGIEGQQGRGGVRI